MGVALSKYYLIITMVTATPEFGTDMFIFHQENDTQQQCLDRLDANPDKYMWAAIKNFEGRLRPKGAYCVKGDIVQEILDENIVNTEGTHQEFHTHNGNIFSCVYWVKTPTGSGNLIFEDPKCPDMLPIRKLTGENDLNRQRICYAAVERRLIIFRSYLRHMVEPCKNKSPRMSIAVNFN